MESRCKNDAFSWDYQRTEDSAILSPGWKDELGVWGEGQYSYFLECLGKALAGVKGVLEEQ